jgi:hypothetical protein
MLNISISLIPLIFALFYPKVGAVLSYSASISGFFMIYVIPVITYLKMKKIEIDYPLLAVAIQENEVDLMIPENPNLPKSFMESPKITGDS